MYGWGSKLKEGTNLEEIVSTNELRFSLHRKGVAVEHWMEEVCWYVMVQDWWGGKHPLGFQGNLLGSCQFWFWQNVLGSSMPNWWKDDMESFSSGCQQDSLGYCPVGNFQGSCCGVLVRRVWDSRPFKFGALDAILRFSIKSQVSSHEPTDDSDVAIS